MLSPFLLLALLPAAVMPVRVGDDGFLFVLCSDHGPVQLVIDPSTGAASGKAARRCAGIGDQWMTVDTTGTPFAPSRLMEAAEMRTIRSMPG